MAKTKRIYKNDMRIDHDLYKLKVAKMLKNVGVDGMEPQIVNVEHCHFFHSFDSSGKPQERCSAIGGHFHNVEAKADKDGNLVAQCSEPKHIVAVKRGKKTVLEVRPIQFMDGDEPYVDKKGDRVTDKHIHDIEYLHSENIPTRKLNKEAVKAMNEMNRMPSGTKTNN